ncbi:MAG: energy transducer TonB [Robiginitomaculum sp.]|nr:energy transducer TonB [Robiginitomaculum sp.]
MKHAVMFLLAGIAISACSTTGSDSTALPNGCTQKYSQIYQPPITLGGAGRVISIPSGYDCPKPTVRDNAQAPPNDNDLDKAYMRDIKFTSLPAGAFATVFEGHGLRSFVDHTNKPLGGCITPCTMRADARKPLFAIGELAKGKGEILPIAIHPLEKKGIEVYFSRAQPIAVTLSALSAGELTPKTEFAARDKDAQPLVRVTPIMPYTVKTGGSCNLVFDVSKQGVPTNIRTTSCDHYVFSPPSITSVAKWQYAPALKNGVAVMRKGVETKVTFILVDKNGKKIT